MIIRTEADRTAAVDALQGLAADWRARSMPDDVQDRFDTITRALDAYDAEVAARPARIRTAPAHPPLAAKYRGLRDICSASERAVAVRDMQELSADWRARTMPDDVCHAFDMLVRAIEAYDADCTTKTSASIPVDPRDSVLAAMRVAARGGSPW